MRISFRTKLMSVVALAAVALLVLILASSLVSGRVESSINRIQQGYLPKLVLRPQLEAQFERLRRGLQDAVAANDADMLAATRAVKQGLVQLVTDAAGAVTPADGSTLQQALDEYYNRAFDVSRRLISGETGESIVADMSAMQATQTRVAELLERATTFDQHALTDAFSAAVNEQRAGARIRLIVSAICLLLVIVVSLWISRGVLRSVEALNAGLRRFGEGDFGETIVAASQDELGDVAERANHMATSLERLSLERSRIDWLKTCQAGLATELRGELEPDEMANRAVSFLARYLEAPVGVLYYIAPDDRFHLLGRHALARPAGEPAPSFAWGEGLVGQAALQTEITVINEPPPAYLKIRSGTADGAPRALVLVPLLRTGKVRGVLELALLGPWSERAAELLLAVRDTVSIAIEVALGTASVRAQRAALEEKNLELVDARQRLEQKAAELASASAFKSQFLANMSHELRTPLNAIIGFTELMHDGLVDPTSPKHKQFLGHVLTSARHLLQLINDVLDLAKVEAGKLDFQPERVQLPLLVGEVVAILRTTAVSKRLRLDSTVDPDLHEVVLDPARLKQVLYNYVSNALKFTPEGGQVMIRALAAGPESFRLEVQDTGPGIAEKDLPRLFGEFQQIKGKDAHPGGTGLGLALTKRLVEAQGGTVGVHSKVGAGSTFHAILPRRQRADAGPPVPTPTPTPAVRPGGPTVLVIEDDANDRAALVESLAQAGYATEVATTGAQALAMCRSRRFDAITLDLLLPDTTGLQVLQQLRAEGANGDVPVIVITVVAEPGAIAGFAVHDLLPKPLDRKSLLASLARAGVASRGPGAVLVVDDDAAALSLMASALEQLGYQAHCAQDAESGLRMAEGLAPRAIVLDLLMPGMNGFEFLDRLRGEPSGRSIPVIIWTAKELSHAEGALLRASAHAVVAKGRGGCAGVVAELAAFLGQGPPGTGAET